MRFLIVLASLLAICAAGTVPESLDQRLVKYADQNGDIDFMAESQEGIAGEICRKLILRFECFDLKFYFEIL